MSFRPNWLPRRRRGDAPRPRSPSSGEVWLMALVGPLAVAIVSFVVFLL